MLSITCRCILYALVSVVVPWGVALGWVRMRLGGEKSTVYSLQKARLHHWFAPVYEKGRHGHITMSCLQTNTSIITMSVTWLCSPLGLELIVKRMTLLTVFTFILKTEARDYGKGRYISDACLWCSANHNAMCQMANQSRLRLSEGETL